MWLTLKDSDMVDEFYKYRSEELPEVGEVIAVVRFLRDGPDSCSRNRSQR